MKNNTLTIIIWLLLTLTTQTGISLAQQAKINPFSITTSTLIDDLKAYKLSNPGIAAEEFVKTANTKLGEQGLNYTFLLDESICQKVEQYRKTMKDPTQPVPINGKLNTISGEAASLALPEVKVEKSECGRCAVQIPVLEMTEKDFVAKVQSQNIKFFLPPAFVLNEAALVDNVDLTRIIQRWKVPFRSIPLSISSDGKILYLGLAEPELNDLALMVFSEGVIQFCRKKDIDPQLKGSLLKDFPKDAANPNLAYINFAGGEVKQTVRFLNSCQ